MIRDQFMLLVLLGSLFALPATSGPSQAAVDLTVDVGAGAEARTDTLSLDAGQELTFEATGRGGAADSAIGIYVYQTPGVLVARNDPDSVPFKWRVINPGKYYVVLRNAGDAAGSVRIRATSTRFTVIGRRPPGAVTLRVFFVTDRKKVGTVPADLFGAEPAGGLSYGYSDVSIPREHRLGELEGPSIWRLELRPVPGKHVVVLSVEPESEQVFFDRVSKRVALSRGKEALLFIHGFNVTFETAMRRTAQIAYDLNFDGAAIAFSWPSRGSILPLAYTRDQRNAELSAESLRRFLVRLGASGHATIHVIAHSMGSRVLHGALQQIRESGGAAPQRLFQEVALFAPDIDAELFERAAPQIAKSAKRVTLYASSRDGALRTAQRVAGYRRAGQGGAGIVVIPPIQSIDASAVDTSLLGLNHSYYADNRTILSDLFAVLRGVAPDDRPSLSRDPKGTYWRFRPAVR